MTIYALGSDRPRHVMLLHKESGLAGSITLKGDEASPQRVTLQRSASIRGRAVDAAGDPIINTSLAFSFAHKTADELYRFHNLTEALWKTDADGRFEIADLIPGERFQIYIEQNDRPLFAKLSNAQRTLTPGQQLDIGNVIFAPPKQANTDEPAEKLAPVATPAAADQAKAENTDFAGDDKPQPNSGGSVGRCCD